MAKNIEAQLQEYVDKANLRSLEKYFPSYTKKDNDACKQLRFALAQGFYMNTCRKVSHLQKKDSGMVYLTVAEGTFVKTERGTTSSSDYVIYTQL